MLTIIRLNPMGREYTLTEINPTQTLVADANGGSVTINLPISDMSRRWYRWMMNGEYIQVAFNTVPAEQREFLLTGITPKQWNEIFADREDSDREEE